MPVWGWIAVGVTFLVFSIGVGLAVARILGSISREVTALLESEVWAAAPPSRATDEPLESARNEAEQEATHERHKTSPRRRVR
jgi:hypothetical protein